MTQLKNIFYIVFGSLVGLILPTLVSAHENYVLPKSDIDAGMKDWSVNVFSALSNPHNIVIALSVGVGLLVVFSLYYFFFTSKAGLVLDQQIKRLEPVGHVVLRVVLGIFFLTSAYYNAFLGPEIPLTSIPIGEALRPVLVIVGGFLIVGLFTEIASLVGLVILILTTFVYRDYMLTYFNYFGEFVALILFGSRIFSLDGLVHKGISKMKQHAQWEIPVIRIAYGISILYPAITIKILHPSIMVEIVNQYHLNQIHWLFPADPLLISLGSGLAQIALGLFIILGFETRLNALATFILYLLSILYFKEAVWPHYILLALALYLVINDGGGYSIDNWLIKRKNKTFSSLRGVPTSRDDEAI